MKDFFKKLLLGKFTDKYSYRHKISPIKKRLLNIRAIWNNDHHDDNGIEKIFRLFLSMSQLVFPGVYIKHYVSKIGFQYMDLAMDLYILIKLIFPFLVLSQGWYSSTFILVIMIYMLLETVLYVPTLIFASDTFARPRSYKRSMLLLFFNYMEIAAAFAVLYSIGDNMNKPFYHWFDAFYFSIITSNSVGYGDYHPETLYAKVLVSMQVMFFLSFLILFLNFFSAKVKTKGYFSHEEEDY